MGARNQPEGSACNRQVVELADRVVERRLAWLDFADRIEPGVRRGDRRLRLLVARPDMLRAARPGGRVGADVLDQLGLLGQNPRALRAAVAEAGVALLRWRAAASLRSSSRCCCRSAAATTRCR